MLVNCFKGHYKVCKLTSSMTTDKHFTFKFVIFGLALSGHKSHFIRKVHWKLYVFGRRKKFQNLETSFPVIP